MESFPINYGTMIDYMEGTSFRPITERRFVSWARHLGIAVDVFKLVFFHSLRHISFDEFMQHLRASAEAFRTHYFPHRYKLVVAKSVSVPKSAKSNNWVAKLLLNETCLKDYPPVEIIQEPGLGNVYPRFDKDDVILIPDDGLFSGNQMMSFLSDLTEDLMDTSQDVKCHPEVAVLVAATTRIALSRIQRMNNIKCHVFYASIMQSMGEVGRLLEKLYPREVCIDESLKSSLIMCATYFDHKMPDFMSIPDDLVQLFVQGCASDEYSELTKKHQQMAEKFSPEYPWRMTCPVPPYKIEEWTEVSCEL